MAVTALESLVVYGQTPAQGSAPVGYNNGIGPVTSYAGTALLDSRGAYDPGQADTTPIYNWPMSGIYVVVDQVPSAISAVNIAAAQVPVANTALTLVSTSGAGITVKSSAINRITGSTASNLLAIDGVAATQTYAGTALGNAQIQAYDPTTSVSRNVRITSVGNDSTATFKVTGYDIYGTLMTETITGANASIASGKKAFKYILNIVAAGTLSGSNVSVGTGDVYGFPMRADFFTYQDIYWNNALITASTGFVAAVTTNPATSTTGDVRGTYAVQSASDGTKKLTIFQSLSPANIGTNTGVTGVTQA
ncbi:MAG: hypothetical protein KGL39_37410 [Patescibacteria group bacterium]|nr:hypothetical protein [Patescibacteria group bacterium]